MRYSLILLVGLLFAVNVHAQTDYSEDYDESAYSPVDPVVVSQKKGYNTEPVKVTRFDKKKWEEIVDGQDYSEDQRALKRKQQQKDQRRENSGEGGEGTPDREQQDGGDESESSGGRQHYNESESEEEEEDESISSSSTPINSPILSIIVYAVAIGIIAYILFLIFRNTSFKSKGKVKTKKDSTDPSAVVTDIKELEIDRLLREAITSGNYKLAIRICYLGLLKRLDEDGVIVWKKDKTNRDYLSELFSKDMYFNEVKNLTLAYEEVWYGEHNLPVQSYERIISSFKEVDRKLNASRPQ